MKIAIVLVTYNRIKDLKESIRRYEAQTKKPNYLIVVNNFSSDGTKEYLDSWRCEKSEIKKIVVSTEKNIGGAGGFSVGINKAKEIECDFVFLADDDAFADEKMIENAMKGYSQFSNKDEISAICTSVISKGEFCLGHRFRIKKTFFNVKNEYVKNAEYAKKYFEVDGVTFVGAFIKMSVIQKIGLPRTEYFIYHDDSEYSVRVRDEGKIFCITSSIMYHDQPRNGIINWKEYYAVRNYLDLIKTYYPRRYYYFNIFQVYLKKVSILAHIFRNRTNAQRKIYKIAIKDALKSELGISNIYYPGADVDKV